MKKLLKLMLVEPSPNESALFIKNLQQVIGFDFTFVVVQTIEDAITKLAVEDIEAIILNLNLPNSTGLDSYEQLRKSALTLPIVTLAGPDNKNLSKKALEAGADGSLAKEEHDASMIVNELLSAIAKRKKFTNLVSSGQIEEAPSPTQIALPEAGLPVAFVVERDPHIKLLLEDFLREGGYEVQFADDGYKALDAVRRKLPRLSILITEMYAPHLDGLRLTRILRGEKDTEKLPIIIMSPVEASERAEAAGANAFLKKPIEKKRVLSIVKAVSGLSQGEGAADV